MGGREIPEVSHRGFGIQHSCYGWPRFIVLWTLIVCSVLVCCSGQMTTIIDFDISALIHIMFSSVLQFLHEFDRLLSTLKICILNNSNLLSFTSIVVAKIDILIWIYQGGTEVRGFTITLITAELLCAGSDTRTIVDIVIDCPSRHICLVYTEKLSFTLTTVQWTLVAGLRSLAQPRGGASHKKKRRRDSSLVHQQKRRLILPSHPSIVLHTA